MAILIVDDSSDAQRLLRSLLTTAGYQDLFIVESITQAFAFLTRSSSFEKNPKIDLILLDIEMPDMNGIEACRRIKADASFHDTPVIMVTAKTEAHVLAEAFAAGATDYITKPFKPVELLARVRSALALKRETDARKTREQELLASNHELQRAIQEIHVLRGLLKICSFCKKIRNDQGGWQQIEIYIREHSEAEFSHGACGECAEKHYHEVLKGRSCGPGR